MLLSPCAPIIDIERRHRSHAFYKTTKKSFIAKIQEEQLQFKIKKNWWKILYLTLSTQYHVGLSTMIQMSKQDRIKKQETSIDMESVI